MQPPRGYARRGSGCRAIRSANDRVFQAVMNDEADVVLRFIDLHDWDVETRQNGETAMHIAARNNSRNVAQVLSRRHADVNVQDSSGYTPHQAILH